MEKERANNFVRMQNTQRVYITYDLFLFLYLWAILTFMSMIEGRNEVHYVSKLLLCAFDHEYVL